MQNKGIAVGCLYGIPRNFLKSMMQDTTYKHIHYDDPSCDPSFFRFIHHLQSNRTLPCIFISQNAVINMIERLKPNYKKWIQEKDTRNKSIEYLYCRPHYGDDEMLVLRKEDENLYRVIGAQLDICTGYWLNEDIRYNAIDFLDEHQIAFSEHDIAGPVFKGGNINLLDIIYIE